MSDKGKPDIVKAVFENDNQKLLKLLDKSVDPNQQDEDGNTALHFAVLRGNRDAIDTKPLSKEEAMRQLFNENKQKDEESAALAFYYAQQAEKAKANQDNFWSGLKQVTNW